MGERVMMLTSDVALIKDPEEKYQDIVKEFAENPKALDEAFAAAWHKLTTSAFGNEEIARCTGQPPVTRNAPEEAADEGTKEAVEATDETSDGSYALLGITLHLLTVQAILFYAL